MEDDTPGGSVNELRRLEGRLLADRYRIENVVSTGANTVITEAVDGDTGAAVTVKIVRPELAMHSSFRRAFERQVAIARSLTHPNIAKVLDSGEFDLGGESTLFWVVEYLGGGSLRDLYDRGRLLEPSQALVVGLEASRALEAAHAKGVVHTELTPSKMVFGEDARLRIVDFAMAELMGAEAWTEPATVATHVARYASPEQALGLDVDEKTDVYALSLCLIEGITGKVPFAGESTVSTLSARVGKLMPVTADMGSLAAVLERAGRPESEDRWTAQQFGNALVQAASALPRPQPIPIMASSLFGVSMGQRHADAVSDEIVAEVLETHGETVDDVPGVDDALIPGDVAVADPPGFAGDDEVGSAPAAPVDEPVEPEAIEPEAIEPEAIEPEAVETVPIDQVPAAPDQTAQLPASVAAAAALATAPPTTLTPVQSGAADGASPPRFYDVERESRPWGKYIGITLLVLVGIAALGAAAFFLLRTKSYEVPDLTGVDQAVAINEVSGNDWVIETERERSDEVPEVDHVVRTVPAAGERLDEGETFVLVVSDGPELRAIPELTGMTVADAQAALTELQLVGVETAAEFSETVPAGSVVRWQVQDDASLVAGAEVLPETTIALTVSQGPEPRPAPDLVNQTFEEATASLAAVQLVIARADDVFSNDVEAGRVISQDPTPTTPVPRDGTVTVVVSKGPDLVAFPDLTGLTYPAAQAALTAAGYAENSLLGTTEGVFVSATVDGEPVSAGATFPRGTAVDLVFL